MKLTLFLIPLLFFMTSCTIDGNDENKTTHTSDMHITDAAKNAGITLKQEKNSITLSHNGEELVIWFYTDDRNPPLPDFSGGIGYCSEIVESLNINTGSNLSTIWSGMTYEGKRDCIKESTLKNLNVDMSGSNAVVVSGIVKYAHQKFVIDLNTKDIIQTQ